VTKVFCFIFLFFWVSSSNAESLVKNFKKLNNNNYNSNKIYDGKDFFFSLASLKVVNKNNTNILKRKVAIKALKQFKEFYIKKVIKSNDNKIQDKISIKNIRKIEDRKYNHYYIVVLAIPKQGVTYLTN
jgi:hypothetical protein